jgi:hypothetical protein
MPDGTGRRSLQSIMTFLDGVGFPCYREDLITAAEMNDAPDAVCDMLEHIPDDAFQTRSQLVNAIRLAP